MPLRAPIEWTMNIAERSARATIYYSECASVRVFVRV
jgi:hypothetical protein